MSMKNNAESVTPAAMTSASVMAKLFIPSVIYGIDFSCCCYYNLAGIKQKVSTRMKAGYLHTIHILT